MFERLNRKFENWLPEYANDTIDPFKKRLVRAWLRWNPAARAELKQLRQLRAALKGEARQTPPAGTFRRIRDNIRQLGPRKTITVLLWLPWTWGMALAVIVLIVVWGAFPPGIGLEWTGEGELPQVYQVYRALAGEADFSLRGEVSAKPGVAAYQFLDLRVFPGGEYVYLIQAVGQDGETSLSQPVLHRATEALPGQLAFLLGFLVLGYGVLVMGKALRDHF